MSSAGSTLSQTVGVDGGVDVGIEAHRPYVGLEVRRPFGDPSLTYASLASKPDAA